jgi:branched-chain amino acid transport system permease protein
LTVAHFKLKTVCHKRSYALSQARWFPAHDARVSILPNFDVLLSGQFLAAAIVTGSIYAMVALGLNLVYGTMRLINIAHGDLLMVGAYVAFWGFNLLGISPLIAAVLAGLLTGALGAALYFGLFKRMLQSSKFERRLEANSLLIFIGASVILQNLFSLAFTGTSRGYQYLDAVIHIGTISITANRLASFIVSALVCAGTLIFLRLSVNGLAIEALIQKRDAAVVVGVDVDRIQIGSLFFGFAVAGVAGALVSMNVEITPFMGFPFTIASFVVVILGGLGNIFGGVLAGFVVGAIEVYGVALTSSGWRSILIYAIFVAALVLRPEGMLTARGGAR